MRSSAERSALAMRARARRCSEPLSAGDNRANTRSTGSSSTAPKSIGGVILDEDAVHPVQARDPGVGDGHPVAHAGWSESLAIHQGFEHAGGL